MSPSIFIWIIYALWLLLIVYLTISGIGAKRDTEAHLSQSLGLMFAIVAAFLLPYLPWAQKTNSWNNNFRTNTPITRNGQRR